jgi:hypothetical protein
MDDFLDPELEASILDPAAALFSPPKTSKLLQPRKAATSTSTTTSTTVPAMMTAKASGSGMVSATLSAMMTVAKQGEAAREGNGVPQNGMVPDISRDNWWIPAVNDEVSVSVTSQVTCYSAFYHRCGYFHFKKKLFCCCDAGAL